MGSICASAACCAGVTACECLCKGFSACGVQKKSMPRLAYVLLQLVCVLTAFIMMFTIKPLAESWTFLECQEISKQDDESVSACFGTAAVLRMTFALFLFHVIILLSILPRGSCAAMVHDAGWVFKFILIIALFIGCFFLPIGFFLVWAEISRYLSIIFFIIEVLYILVGAYALGEHMVSKEADSTVSENWRNGVLLFYTILLTAGSILLIVFSFIQFQGAVPEIKPKEAAKLEPAATNTTTPATPTPAKKDPVKPVQPAQPAANKRLLQAVAAAATAKTSTPEAPSCGGNVAIISVTIVMLVVVFALRLRE